MLVAIISEFQILRSDREVFLQIDSALHFLSNIIRRNGNLTVSTINMIKGVTGKICFYNIRLGLAFNFINFIDIRNRISIHIPIFDLDERSLIVDVFKGDNDCFCCLNISLNYSLNGVESHRDLFIADSLLSEVGFVNRRCSFLHADDISINRLFPGFSYFLVRIRFDHILHSILDRIRAVCVAENNNVFRLIILQHKGLLQLISQHARNGHCLFLNSRSDFQIAANPYCRLIDGFIILVQILYSILYGLCRPVGVDFDVSVHRLLKVILFAAFGIPAGKDITGSCLRYDRLRLFSIRDLIVYDVFPRITIQLIMEGKRICRHFEIAIQNKSGRHLG